MLKRVKKKIPESTNYRLNEKNRKQLGEIAHIEQCKKGTEVS